MRRYHAHFYGRTKGAIGIFYWIETTVCGDTPDAAQLALYEHIHQLTLTDVTDLPLAERADP